MFQIFICSVYINLIFLFDSNKIESEEKLSRSQLMEIRFNRCILLLHMGKMDDTLRALDELDEMYELYISSYSIAPVYLRET